MTRILLTLMFLVSAVLPLSAQSGLDINKVFNGKYSDDPKVTETYITGNNNYLRKHNLSVFASFRGPADTYASKIQKMVLTDAAKAIGKNVRYKSGKLYFGFYILKPEARGQKKINRYIYYLNTAASGGTNVLLVYMEGTASEGAVSKLIQDMANKENKKAKSSNRKTTVIRTPSSKSSKTSKSKNGKITTITIDQSTPSSGNEETTITID